jgi:hypothetical protein
MPEILAPVEIPNYLGDIEKVQNNQLRQAQLQNYQAELAKAQREQKAAEATQQLGQLYSQGDSRAGQALLGVNPDYHKKITDGIFETSQREASYASSILGAPADQRAAVYRETIKQIRAGKDPLVPASAIQDFPDDFSKDILPKLYSIQQGHRKLEDSIKAPQESATLQSTYADIGLKKAQTAKDYAEIGKIKNEVSGKYITTEQIFNNASKLRNDYEAKSIDFIKTKDAYDRIHASLDNPSAAGDVSAIFAYMKMLDPGSTVREGEQATAREARGVPASILSTYNNLLTGQSLTPGQRKDFGDRAEKLYSVAQNSQKKTADQYSKIAERNNLPVQDVIIDYDSLYKKQNKSGDMSFDPKLYNDFGNDLISAEIAKRKGANR